MRRILLLCISIILIGTLVSCTATEKESVQDINDILTSENYNTKNQSTEVQTDNNSTTEDKDVIEITENAEKLDETELTSDKEIIEEEIEVTLPHPIDTEKFGNILMEYQGEWDKLPYPTEKLIVNGEDVYRIGVSTKTGDITDIFEYHFDLDDENLVIIRGGSLKPQVVTRDEDGNMVLTVTENEKDYVYNFEKVSDNITVPELTKKEKKAEPAIGMTASEVYNSTWGAPKKINKTETAYGVREQYVYDRGYIYLEDGIVTAIQK